MKLAILISIAVVLGAGTALAQGNNIAAPPLKTGFVFMVLGYLVLLAGNVFRDV